jgi:hypothetical protein
VKPATRAEIERLWNAPLSEAEFTRRLALAREELRGDELENLRSLIRWFRRRYPDALSRARYARGKAARRFAPRA